MCGILGIVAPRGARPTPDDRAIMALRDRMIHRGPDGAGLWRHENCALAHRRLAVMDPSPAGAQPMIAPDDAGSPRLALVYNGELYNDAELRAGLRERGVTFSTGCDTETLLRAWLTHATDALTLLRGMYAFGVWDVRSRVLTLARDPLGIKPLYYARTTSGPEQVVFASDPRVVAAHPGVGARPNWRMASAYLTTIRTVLGDQTMYEGVHAVRAGEAIEFDCAGPGIRVRRWRHWVSPEVDRGETWDDGRAADAVRDSLEGATRAHLRSDVPTCALLSGGLDSTVLASIARREAPELRTYCAGAREGAGPEDDDLDVARRAAAFLGTRHEEALVTRASFGERWAWMVGRVGVPLSTPNEVAIHDVASRLRADGCVVTLSGEGADELFAGYDVAIRSALAYRAAASRGEDARGPGAFELESNAWVGPSVKAGVVREEVLRGAEWDAWLARWYEDEFAAGAREVGEGVDASWSGLETHLRFVRRVNLTGLLQRLDTATMLASVEGRTPFADARVAECAEALPLGTKIRALDPARRRGSASGAASGPGVAVAAPPAGALGVVDAEGGWETKSCLRRAFAGVLPREVLSRPKRSFPLPFREWVEDSAGVLRESAFAREVFRDEAVALVGARPRELWNLAWPMINLAMWGDSIA